MTIEKGGAWGARVEPPDGLRVARDDRRLALAVTDGSGQPTRVSGGDLFRTIGGAPAPSEPSLLRVPIDMIEVRLDGEGMLRAAAHVMLRAARGRGGPLRGPVVMVMNAEFMGDWDVATRGHPNDGRLDVVTCDASLGVRQRLAVRRRLANGTHLPHPALTARAITTASWTFDHPVVVIADGCRVGRARAVDVDVLPDAAVVYA